MSIKDQAGQYGAFDGPYYLALWKGLFRAALGWSERQTEEWASRYAGFLSDPDDILFNQTPVYWACTALIPEALRERLDRRELSELKHRLVSAPHGDPDDADPAAIDWEPFRREVGQILAEYDCRGG